MLNRAEMYNRRAGAPKFKANEVIKKLCIEKGNTIADIGSGGGFFTMHFAASTGLDGKVYAVDVNSKNLEYVKKQAEERQLGNIITLQISRELKGLPKNGCDLIFLRNVYHHITNPEEYFLKLKRYLKINGIVAIIDYKKTNKISFINLTQHYVRQEDIINTMKKCNYIHLNSYNFIEQQSFNIFKI